MAQTNPEKKATVKTGKRAPRNTKPKTDKPVEPKKERTPEEIKALLKEAKYCPKVKPGQSWSYNKV